MENLLGTFEHETTKHVLPLLRARKILLKILFLSFRYTIILHRIPKFRALSRRTNEYTCLFCGTFSYRRYSIRSFRFSSVEHSLLCISLHVLPKHSNLSFFPIRHARRLRFSCRGVVCQCDEIANCQRAQIYYSFRERKK